MPPLSEPIADSRRYDLDWLRFIAFALLIFYHIGMFYVSWGWHVKSVYASPAAEPLMSLLNPWRLSLLFFISGVAVRFAADKMAAGAFAASRLKRLGLPILFGITVIVVPQPYFELVQAGEFEGGYPAFYRDYLNPVQLFPMITPTWNHLWYVVYLLVYVLILAPFMKPLSRFAAGTGGESFGKALGHPASLLFVVILPFIAYALIFGDRFPETHDLLNDWHNHANRFTIFLIGYFAAKNARFWNAVDRARWPAAGFVLAIGAVIIVYTAIPGFRESYPLGLLAGTALMTLYAWSMIVLLMGLAQRLLNRKSRLLAYLTEAIFPYYILHQTIIVIAGFYLTQLALGAWPEFALVMLATVGGCVLLHEFVIRRIGWLRPLFGLRPRARRNGGGLSPAAAQA
ncbi:acyltransferase family protein [Parasphingopyxis algicola]|uniref:acyltransferase family protein n=1 Tax=Parasphingopyxis algicola TaxID=2026624 RepID=UPI0015A05E5B|nr:acyltransferase family protein [Parasphingopyxis algicola]QLC23628.1 acyltransferase family protein [Parasphingopyxis algicola]